MKEKYRKRQQRHIQDAITEADKAHTAQEIAAAWDVLEAFTQRPMRVEPDEQCDS